MDPTERHQTLALAREQGRLQETQLGPWQYLRLNQDCHELPEGTVVFGDTVIFGYPHIGRIFWLTTGLREQLSGPCWVEEKVDGYNVRLFRHGDSVLALTRRGYLCPFTSDRLADLLDLRVFAEQPDLVLCAEVAGPENPYNEAAPAAITEDVRLFVFDAMRHNRLGLLPPREKLALVERYGLPAVPQFGLHRLDDLEPLRALLLELDRTGREGVVFKEDTPPHHRIKYVTGNSALSDLRATSLAIRQLPAEYFMQRVLRLALFRCEHGLPVTGDLAQALGESLLDGMVAAIDQQQRQHKVCHTFRCRFRQRANAELLMAALGQRLGEGQVRLLRLAPEGAYWRLEFTKGLPRTTGLLGHLLSGGLVFD